MIYINLSYFINDLHDDQILFAFMKSQYWLLGVYPWVSPWDFMVGPCWFGPEPRDGNSAMQLSQP